MVRERGFVVGKEVYVIDVLGADQGAEATIISAKIDKVDSCGIFVSYKNIIKRANCMSETTRKNFYFYSDYGLHFFETEKDAFNILKQIPKCGDTVFSIESNDSVMENSVSGIKRGEISDIFYRPYIALASGKEYTIEELDESIFNNRYTAYRENVRRKKANIEA